MFRRKTFKPTIIKNKLAAGQEEDSVQKPMNSHADAVGTNSTAEQNKNPIYLETGLQLGSEADQNEFQLRKIDITVSRQKKGKSGIIRTLSMLPRRSESNEIFY